MHKNTIKEVRLISNNCSTFYKPAYDEEVQQELTINDKGEVCLIGYDHVIYKQELEKMRTEEFKISGKEAEKLLAGFTVFFDYKDIVSKSTDFGIWDLEIRGKDGNVSIYTGSLCTRIDYEGQDLSDLVRDVLGIEDLFVFDGRSKPDLINRITLDYLRTTIIEPSYEWEYEEVDEEERER